MNHSPTPWEADEAGGYIRDKDGFALAEMTSLDQLELEDANAAHIVKCVNLHDELVQALQDVLEDHLDGGDCDCAEKVQALLAKAKQ